MPTGATDAENALVAGFVDVCGYKSILPICSQLTFTASVRHRKIGV